MDQFLICKVHHHNIFVDLFHQHHLFQQNRMVYIHQAMDVFRLIQAILIQVQQVHRSKKIHYRLRNVNLHSPLRICECYYHKFHREHLHSPIQELEIQWLRRHIENLNNLPLFPSEITQLFIADFSANGESLRNDVLQISANMQK